MRRQSNGLRINLSKEQTDKQLKMFIEAAKPILNLDVDEETILNKIGIPPTQNLYSRFFLAVGDEVYENRKYILAQLKSIPDGNKYFQLLMKSLSWFERGNEDSKKALTPQFQGYPKNINEAEKYFF